MYFPQLPASSKVWIYQSQTEIPMELQSELQSKLNLFISGWAAHGKELFGDATILENYFIVLAVDESKIRASGCSIDTSVHFMKQLAHNYNLELFNRLNVLIETEGNKSIVHFSNLSKYSNSFVYNPLIQSLDELRTNWKVRVSESQFA